MHPSTNATAGPRFPDDGLYTGAVHLARHTPALLDSAIRLWSDYGLGLFAVFMLVALWRARGGRRPVLPVLAVPVVVVLTYAVNDVLKSLVDEARPCQVLHVTPLEACPGPGDWSFPSNHATIAAATVAALLWVDRRVALAAAPFAVLMAASRVWIGVHYPHDVLAGLVVGFLVAALLTRVALAAWARLRVRGRAVAPGAPAQ